MVSRVLAQRVAAYGHGGQAADGPLVIARLIVGKANLVLQRRLDAALVQGGVLVEVLSGFLELVFLVIRIADQQLNLVGALGRRRVLQRLGGIGNQAVVVAFFVINLGHHGRHHGLVGIVLLGHGQVGAGGGVIAGAVAQVTGVVGASVLELALNLLVAVEQQAGFFVILLLEVAVGQLEVRFGPLVVVQVDGRDLGKVANGGLVVFLVEVELAELKVGRGRLRVRRVPGGKVQDEALGIGVREVEAAHGIVVLGIGGAVASRGAGLAGVHRLSGQVAPERLLGGPVLAAVEQLQPFLKVPLIGGKNLSLLGLGDHGGRGTEGGGQRQPGK